MKWTTGYIYTLKDDPADAEIPSHKLMIRGGYIRKLAQGIFTYGPLALRSIRKFENILREELDKQDCVELLMPMVQPAEIWRETGRWQKAGDVLLKVKNKMGQDFCLGPTHEEVITDYVRGDIKSYRDLPKNLYQIQTKYRDEIRPRFGLMRGREFIMKDAYSFDVDKEAAIKSYDKMFTAYKAIFSRLGVEFRHVKADSGNIGGDKSEEFHILADFGEDLLMVSDQSNFAANVEVCPVKDETKPHDGKDLKPIEEFATPKIRSIEALAKAVDVAESELVKTMFFATGGEEDLKPICVLLRGDHEVNPIKLKNELNLDAPPQLLTDDEVKEITGGASPGSCGPVGLKVPVYADHGIRGLKNYITGANRDDYHIKNVNHDRDFEVTAWGDYRLAKEGDPSPDGQGNLKAIRGIEVGHIFYLGSVYSAAMKAQYLDSAGKLHPIEMGCYGIGVSRTVQAVIEQCHDKDGIIWPMALAPFHVHICLLDPKDEKVAGVAEELYQNDSSSSLRFDSGH